MSMFRKLASRTRCLMLVLGLAAGAGLVPAHPASASALHGVPAVPTAADGLASRFSATLDMERLQAPSSVPAQAPLQSPLQAAAGGADPQAGPAATAPVSPSSTLRPLTFGSFARQLLVFGHLMLFAFAIVTILREDFALVFAPRRLPTEKLLRTQRLITFLLSGLWITGCALVVLEVGWSLQALLDRPKLLAKISLVLLLTLNGMLLHRHVFPLLCRRQTEPQAAAVLCSLFGAFSSVTWLYASFVGAARLIAPAMSYSMFMGLYSLALIVGIAAALALVRPRMEDLLGRHSTMLDTRFEDDLGYAPTQQMAA